MNDNINTQAMIMDKIRNGTLSEMEFEQLRSTDAYKKLIADIPREELLPVFFKFQGQPYSLEDYPQFKTMYPNEYVPDSIWIAGRQCGKSFWINDLQKIVDKFGRMLKPEDLKPGQEILSLDSNFKCVVNRITAKFFSGFKSLYKIKTRLGSEVSISSEHRMKTLHGYTALGDMVVGSRIAHLQNGGLFGDKQVDKDRIILTAYMIGDGSSAGKTYSFTGETAEVLSEIDQLRDSNHIRTTKDKRTKATYRLTFRTKHPIYEWFKEDGLAGKYSYNKIIPDWVFELSKEDTALFLSRLWATDGSVKLYNGSPSISYSTASLVLSQQIRDILHKFGIISKIRHKKTSCNGKQCRDAHELTIEGQSSQQIFLDTFKVPGKALENVIFKYENNNRHTIPIEIYETLKELFKDSTYNHKCKSLRDAKLCVKPKYPLSHSKLARYIAYAEECNLTDRPEYKFLCDLRDSDVIWDEIKSIEYIGEHPAWDITVESTESFVIDGLISHNSLNLSRSEVMDCIQIPNFQIVFVAPLKDQTARYSNLYLNEAVTSCPFARALQDTGSREDEDAGPIMRNQSHKSWANNAGIQLTYAKTSSDRARGIYADRIDFDEVQDQLIDNLPIITQSLTQSKWGLRRFTGTAKTVDNTIEALFQQSSMNEWCMKCSGCNHWNIPNLEGKVFDMIKADGPHCVKCGKLLDVRAGEFVAKHPNKLDTFIGHHIPQIVIPAIVENKKKWARLVHKVLNSQMPIIMQEILGISCNVGARLITQEDIDNCCILPSVAKLRNKLNDYIFTVGGVDWGIAEVTSFTVHTIIGIKPDGKIDVLWAKRFVGFDPDSVLQEIAKAHTLYKCDLLCCDFGMGFDKNIMLDRRFGLPVIQIEYSSQNQLLTHRPILGYSRWMIDKASSLDILFWTIKYGGIRFPPKNEFDDYTQDLLSPYEQVTDTGGIQRRKYLRNPNMPDDFCHALLFAMVGGMKLAGHDALDIVPDDKMDSSTIPGGELKMDDIKVADILRSMT